VVERLACHLPVIKALRIGQGGPAPEFSRFRGASAFLLDSAVSGHYGGTGVTGNWHAARAVAQTQRIILAGGLTPENVGEAIRIVRPYAVDVTSGVEARPGKKDPGKLRTFFEEVARASREVS
jgi:phosphoribosylanthranilate isomerase